VSSPSGSPATHDHSRARRNAASTSSSLAPGRARQTFSRMLAEKRWESWPATAIARRTSAWRYSRRSRPASRDRPASGSRKRSSRLTTVVFPAPLGPTRATRDPGSRRRLTPSSAARSPGA
jgi:hypothetical protein